MEKYKEYKKINNDFFEQLINDSKDEHSKVGWSTNSHQKRLNKIIEIGNLNNSSVLDIGCGLGAFYGFLKEKNINIDYYGFDVSEKMIGSVKKIYPEIASKFLLHDILTEETIEEFDYTVSIGSINLFLDEKTNYGMVFRMLEKMYKHSKIGFAFSMTSSLSRKKNNDTFYYDPKKIIDHVSTFCNNFRLDHSYLPHDLTVFGYKDDFYSSVK
jgi:cyclopropane fatty-acyl-phospholipid synthase-like methyltransferase